MTPPGVRAHSRGRAHCGTNSLSVRSASSSHGDGTPASVIAIAATASTSLRLL